MRTSRDPFTDDVVTRLVSLQRGDLERVKKDNPRLAAALERMSDGFAETVQTTRNVNLSPTLKITDIVSEKLYFPPPLEDFGPGGAAWLRAHEEFDKAAPNRRGVLATGSGHDIVRDRPDQAGPGRRRDRRNV